MDDGERRYKIKEIERYQSDLDFQKNKANSEAFSCGIYAIGAAFLISLALTPNVELPVKAVEMAFAGLDVSLAGVKLRNILKSIKRQTFLGTEIEKIKNELNEEKERVKIK